MSSEVSSHPTTARRPALYRQPIKALVMLGIITVLTVVVYFLTASLGIPMWQGPSGNTFLLFRIASWQFFVGYVLMWQVSAHYFELWSFNKLIKGKFKQGVASASLATIVGTIIILLYYYLYNPSLPASVNELVKIEQAFGFTETVIFAFALWYFWLENQTPVAGKQPIQGGLMLVALWGVSAFLTWGTFYIPGPIAGSYIPPLGIYVTWIWFPSAIGSLLALEGWPLQGFKQPFKGIVGLLEVIPFTMINWLILLHLNMDPISFNASGLLFEIILTFTVLFFSVATNHAPFRRLKQPAKGFSCIILGVVAAVIVYLITVAPLGLPMTGIAVGTPSYNIAFSAFLIIDMALVFQWVMLFTMGWWFAGYTSADVSS